MDQHQDGLSRRQLLERGALAGGSLTAAGLVAACGGSASSATTSTSATAKPKMGGTLRVGVSGGGAHDNINAFGTIGSTIDGMRQGVLYETAFYLNRENVPVPLLAEEPGLPNAAATEWTVRLRQGVEFHNGKTMTADDLIWSVNAVGNPKTAAPGASYYQTLDIKRMVKMDAHTVRFVLGKPNAFFETQLIYAGPVVPVGYHPSDPVGTGPFKYKSFSPGVQSVFDRFHNYWGGIVGGPYLDAVVIIDFNDDTSRMNALLSGAIDGAAGVPYADVPIVQNAGKRILTATGASFMPFVMQCQEAPFSDVRVRQAMRLIVDRPQMVAEALSGHGVIASDVYLLRSDPLFNPAIPERPQDIEQAKSLLKAAGQSNLAVTLTGAPVLAGAVEMCEVLVQQAKAAGVTITLRQVPVAVLYGSQFKHWPFADDFNPSTPYFVTVANWDTSTAPYNSAQFKDPEFDKLYQEAYTTLDVNKRRELAYQMEEIQFTRGGYVIWGFHPQLDGLSTAVHGFVEPDFRGSAFNNQEFARVWLT